MAGNAKTLTVYLLAMSLLIAALAGCPLPTEPPAANFTAVPANGEAPLTVNFLDTSESGTSPITSWSWNFRDGATSHERNPIHTFNTGGTFDVTLTVTSNAGISSAHKSVVVYDVGEGEGEGEGEGTLEYVGSLGVFFNAPGPGISEDLTGATVHGGFSIVRLSREPTPPTLDTCRMVSYEDPVTVLSVTYLDAGDQAQAQIGTQLVALARTTTPAEDGSGVAIGYESNPLFVPALPGDTVTFEWQGGPDIGAFSTSIPVVGPPVFSQPVFTVGQYGYSVDFDFDKDLVLRWNVDRPGDSVVISIGTVKSGTTETRECDCFVRDDGYFVVPAEYLDALRFEGAFGYSLFAQRDLEVEVQIPLTHGGIGLFGVNSSANHSASSY